MGREVRRVPLDFDHPLNEVWPGFRSPERFEEDKCPDCKNGYAPHAQDLYEMWYGGIVPFDPSTTGSEPLTADTPAVRARAERNVADAPWYYGAGEEAVVREARRLADLWNGMWCHHLSQEDVQALVDGNRLWDFTREFVPGRGWRDRDTPTVPTAAEVNEWSLRGLGHDDLNASIAVRARCEREGHPVECPRCGGYGSLERYPGQRAEADAWEPTEPPVGDGWQLWETVSEGSPISPVFPDAEGLARWLTTDDACWGAMRKPMTISAARQFVRAGWAPSLIGDSTGVHDGATYVSNRSDLGAADGEAEGAG